VNVVKAQEGKMLIIIIIGIRN